MSSQAIPNYTVPQPQIASPLQTIGGLMNLRAQINEAALRGAQVEQAKQAAATSAQEALKYKAETDQKNRDLSDQNTVSAALKDPEVYTKVYSGDLSPIAKLGVQDTTLTRMQAGIDTHIKELATQDKESLARRSTALTDIGQTAQNLLDQYGDDPATLNQILPETIRNLSAAGLFKDAKVDPSKLPTTISDRSQLEQWVSSIGAGKAATDAAIAHKTGVAEADKKAADAVIAKIGIPKAQAETNKAEEESRVAQATGQATLEDPGYLNPEQRQQATQAAATLAETKLRDEQTAKNENARIALERSKDAREQHIYEQTYGAGANEALQGVEPKLRVAATAAAQKAASEYQTATKSADDIQTFIDLARKGNKAAGSNLPLVGVEAINALAGIKRINRTEVDQYQGAGSLLDKIQGKIGGLVAGQPIPADVLNDIESLHKTLTDNAGSAYNQKLQGINQNYHANFKAVPGTAAKSAGSIPTPGTQAEYNALPKGAQFYKPNDTKVYTKQ